MANILTGLIILALLGGAIYKIYRDKKNNVKCSGCSYCPSNSACEDSKAEDFKIKNEKQITK